MYAINLFVIAYFVLNKSITNVSSKQNFRNQITKRKMKIMEASKFHLRPDIAILHRASKLTKHRVVFAAKQDNIDLLKNILMEVSDPQSIKYGKHLSRYQINQISSNNKYVDNILNFLKMNGITVLNTTISNDYIITESTIGKWEELFNTEFYVFTHTRDKEMRFIRSYNYSLSEDMISSIDAVFNTVQIPEYELHQSIKYIHNSFATEGNNGYVTPKLINDLYSIKNNKGSSNTSQAVYGILNQVVSSTDLNYFQNYFHLPQQGIHKSIGGHVYDYACVNNVQDCIEANLDVQYIMSVAQNVPTTYYYWDGADVWLDWIIDVANMNDPPHVISISYGSYELSMSTSYLKAFDLEAIKLGIMGVSIIVAAGDDGVAGFLSRTGRMPCDYYADFPASSPYVTAVGGTMGPESDNPEVGCQSDRGSSITTGGGFSHYSNQHIWQEYHINKYLKNIDGTSIQPLYPSFDTTKRAYPDISALANKFIIVANKDFYVVSGTSASTPVIAGMISLINSARVDAGNSTLGWLNPSLYSLALHFTNDIVQGNNKCKAEGYSCCSQGFYATEGWDPVTGLGTIDFIKFKDTMLNISSTDYSTSSQSNSNQNKIFNISKNIFISIFVTVLASIFLCFIGTILIYYLMNIFLFKFNNYNYLSIP